MDETFHCMHCGTLIGSPDTACDECIHIMFETRAGRKLMEEIAELRTLVQDYYTTHYGDLTRLAQDIQRGSIPIEQFVQGWQQERDVLQQRARVLLHGTQESEQ